MQKIYNTLSGDIYFDSNFIKPLNGFVTSEFGSIRVANGSFNHYHNCMDFRAKVGQKVISSNSGIVRVENFKYDSGYSVVIDHGGGIYTQYFHLSKMFVKPGIKVAKGDILGLSGASGMVSGSHLHFGVAVNGVQVNPSVFIEKTDNLFN
ncbi:M23 family metallopeptidase [Campylobacter hyointestinalis]|uniref:M23 family metallopeptidase n=1 Tax=Campylobacter hyointestinalis TaxID=198 RepID=UPI0007C89456|nr:M23 family metallopeptidase [Campylobacter hyointestinalis]